MSGVNLNSAPMLRPGVARKAELTDSLSQQLTVELRAGQHRNWAISLRTQVGVPSGCTMAPPLVLRQVTDIRD